MKCVFVLCLLSLVTLAFAGTNFRPSLVTPPFAGTNGCIYVEGRCYKGCPEGTHSYTTGCGRKLPEATCDQPTPVLEEGNICDYSACYCDSPTVRDLTTNKCVPLEECPQKVNEE